MKTEAATEPRTPTRVRVARVFTSGRTHASQTRLSDQLAFLAFPINGQLALSGVKRTLHRFRLPYANEP